MNSLRAGGDIALLELEEPSALTAAPLPDPRHVPDGELLALGWGRYSLVLQQAYLEIETAEVCESTWDNVGPSVICASSKNADTCRGITTPHQLIWGHLFNQKLKPTLIMCGEYNEQDWGFLRLGKVEIMF